MNHFVIFITLFTSAITAYGAEKEEEYFTGTLSQGCECEDSVFSFADMETTTRKVKFKRADSLGRLCVKKESVVACRIDFDDPQESGGIACPTKCVSLKKSPRLSDGDRKTLFEHSLEANRAKFRTAAGAAVFKDFEKRFLSWDPLVSMRGSYPEYSPLYELVRNSALKAPISYLSEGKVVNEWFMILLFFPDRKAALEQRPNWGLWKVADGSFVHSSPLKDLKAMVPPHKLVPRVTFRTGEPLITRFGYEWYDFTHQEGNTGKSYGLVYEADLNSLLGMKIAAPPEKSENHWVNMVTFENPNINEVVGLISGAGELRADMSEKTTLIYTCKAGALAVFSKRHTYAAEKGWYRVYCEGKDGWIQSKSLRVFPFPTK